MEAVNTSLMMHVHFGVDERTKNPNPMKIQKISSGTRSDLPGDSFHGKVHNKRLLSFVFPSQ
jgi:hypothetical protein